MTRTSEWAIKVLAVLKAGNADAAIAQIRVAPNVKDLKALQAALAASPLAGRWRDVESAIEDNITALSAPRLHRSP